MEMQERDKMFKIVKAKKRVYKKLLREYIAQSKILFGTYLHRNYYMPEDYDYNLLNGEFFRQKNPQGFSIPLSNRLLQQLRKMPKKSINTTYVERYRGKIIYGKYLISNHNEKTVLFAFSIVIDEKEPTKFSIKLDACIQGKDWMNLCRFDASGIPHPNYIVNGEIVENAEDIEMCETPHMHVNSQEAQVLFGNKLDDFWSRFIKDKNRINALFSNCLDYSTAVHIPREQLCQSDDEKEFFLNSINYFMKFVNIKETLNTKLFAQKVNYSQDIFCLDNEVVAQDKGGCYEIN